MTEDDKDVQGNIGNLLNGMHETSHKKPFEPSVGDVELLCCI